MRNPLRKLAEMRDALGQTLSDNSAAAAALHQMGWLGVSGEGIGGDIRALAQAWSDAEVRAARADALRVVAEMRADR
jgi:hypothetical protein